MCLTVANELEVAAFLAATEFESTNVSRAPKQPGAGARISRRFQEEKAMEQAMRVAPGADKLAKQLAHYKLHKAISTGSSCSVYIGQRAGCRAPIAVKVMPSKSKSRLTKKGLAMEVKCLKKLQATGKRCFAGFIESFLDRFNHYIVMEYVPRGTLWTCVERAGGTLPVTLVRMMMAEVVDGLICLKENRIIHRDLKPENLMVDMFGHVVIVDFGLALMFEEGEPELAPASNTICGTPGYIAPEIMDGKPYSYGVDVWSLGCVMFELLTGCRPYDGNTYDEVYQRMKIGTYKYPRSSRVDFHTEFFIEQLLDMNAKRRITLEDMKDMDFFEDIDWDRVAVGNYDASFYLHFTRERGIPITRAIDKSKLIDKTLVDTKWYPDHIDMQFVTPYNAIAGLPESPQEPVYDDVEENKAEKLFYRKPRYIGKKSRAEVLGDYFRVAHPMCSGGSSEFLNEDLENLMKDETPKPGQSVDLSKQKSTEIDCSKPHPMLRRIPIPGIDYAPVKRSQYVPPAQQDPHQRQRQNFIAKYGKRKSTTPPVSLPQREENQEPPSRSSEPDSATPLSSLPLPSPATIEPVIARRGLCISNIPDLTHSESYVTNASSLPVTPIDYDLPDDAWAPKVRRKYKERANGSVGSTIRDFFKDLGSARFLKLGLGF